MNSDEGQKYLHETMPMVGVVKRHVDGRDQNKPVISIVGAGAPAYAQRAAYALVEQFYQRVNERAEKDMLAGNPVTGAHHRALEAEIAIVRALAEK